jgi:hypothetical protein
VSIRLQEDDSILLQGVTDASGCWQAWHNFDPDTPIALVLSNSEKELIRCRVPLHAINPMECMMTKPPKRSHDEIHKLWRKKYREMKAKGIANPDPEAVGRQAFKY